MVFSFTTSRGCVSHAPLVKHLFLFLFLFLVLLNAGHKMGRLLIYVRDEFSQPSGTLGPGFGVTLTAWCVRHAPGRKNTFFSLFLFLFLLLFSLMRGTSWPTDLCSRRIFSTVWHTCARFWGNSYRLVRGIRTRA